MADHDFILQAADDLLANTPALVAYAKAKILAEHDDKQRDLGASVCVGGQRDDQSGTTIRNRLADEAFEDMVLAALRLVAARQQHLSAIRTMDLLVGSLKANLEQGSA